MGWLWGRGGENELTERIIALEKAVEGLQSKIRLLKNEWEDVLDRANRVMGRLNARIRKSEATSATESDAEPVPHAAAPTEIVGTHAQLSAMRGRRGRGLLPR